jgi:splicing factor U2AF subunit
VFVEFETAEQAEKASKALGGRSFAMRVVVTSYLDEEKYSASDFN